MMKTAFIVILLVFLAGCSQEIDQIKNITSNETAPNKIPSITLRNIKHNEEKQVNIDVEKEYEAKGFGIFDFNILKKENCKEKYNIFKNKAADINQHIRDEQEELEDELKDLEKAEADLGIAQNSGDEDDIEEALEDYQSEKEDAEDVEDGLEDLERLKRRYEIISEEINKICARFLAGG